ncbi:MAG TPA: carboxypeptidase-like regulatory domain-containing protein [Bacteroidales bacterium]|nr:carboxypeptidase-like regulatory domain-containing protein [Bacteroidales bacterium]
MKQKLMLLLLFSLNSLLMLSQNHVRINGIVKDSITGEVLIGATILDTVTKKGTITDYNGYFNLTVSVPASLKISYVGYLTQRISLSDTSVLMLEVKLIQDTNLQEVYVYSSLSGDINQMNLTTKEISRFPSLGGKPDISKSLQNLPGINTQNEGSGSLLVRGGDPGQNLYLFDNVPILHVNHLGGFMSVFNPDIINNIDVYKGGFPARYGGKISSIIDIVQKEGNTTHMKGSIGIGLTDLSFQIEGPTKLEHTSFIVTGRKTLTDPLMALASKYSDGNDYIVAYGFHDINGKFTWKPNLSNSFNINLYYGDDYLNYWQNTDNSPAKKHHQGYTWGNVMISSHWKSILNSRSYSSTNLSYSRYRIKEVSEYTLAADGDNDFYNQFLSTVQNISIRSLLKYELLPNWSAEFGFQSSLQFYLPSYTSTSRSNYPEKEHVRISENVLYATNRIKLLKHSYLDLGFRLSSFYAKKYTDFFLEPRVNLKLGLSSNQKLILSYMTAKQYSHLIFTTGNIMHNEVWIPSGDIVKPARSEQYTVGWGNSIKDGKFYFDINLFYKKMSHLSTYKDGYSSFKGDENWRSKIELNGQGEAVGLEIFIKKRRGKITGFAGYTFSRVTRKYPGINNGKEFVFDFDRPHSLSTHLNYKIKKNVSLAISWIYQSGLPYTPAIGKHYIPSFEANNDDMAYLIEGLIYAERNSARMKNYHRLDIGLHYEITTKRNRKALWTFSIYNLYNRKNPYYYYYNTKGGPEMILPEQGNEVLPLKLYQISFFPIIPSVSYKLYFDGSKKAKDRKQNLKKWLYHEN